MGIDLSETSLAAARTYAERLGVGDNLTLRRLAIEDASALNGQFDYVIASGVLHHLADPDAGLRALASVLAPTGGLGVSSTRPTAVSKCTWCRTSCGA